MRIIFVCHGNTCRSPMAEVIANAWLKQGNLQIPVLSAGITAREGSPASGGAQAAMENHGLDLSSHRARSIWDLDLQSTDILWCMQTPIAKHLTSQRPEAHCVTLGEAAGTGDEVQDPFGGSLRDYQTTAHTLTRLVASALSRRLGLRVDG